MPSEGRLRCIHTVATKALSHTLFSPFRRFLEITLPMAVGHFLPLFCSGCPVKDHHAISTRRFFFSCKVPLPCSSSKSKFDRRHRHCILHVSFRQTVSMSSVILRHRFNTQAHRAPISISPTQNHTTACSTVATPVYPTFSSSPHFIACREQPPTVSLQLHKESSQLMLNTLCCIVSLISTIQNLLSNPPQLSHFLDTHAHVRSAQAWSLHPHMHSTLCISFPVLSHDHDVILEAGNGQHPESRASRLART